MKHYEIQFHFVHGTKKTICRNISYRGGSKGNPLLQKNRDYYIIQPATKNVFLGMSDAGTRPYKS